MKKVLITIACGVALGLIPTHAWAVTINLTYDPDTGGPNFVGTIIDDVPSGEAAELAYIADLIEVPVGIEDVVGTIDYFGDSDVGQTEIYDRRLSTLDPLEDVSKFLGKKEGNDLISPYTGWLYVLAKYDQDSAGGLVFLVYVTSGDVITVPGSFNGHNLSHISLFSTTLGLDCVPDGGATLMLLGGALVGLGALRRRFHA